MRVKHSAFWFVVTLLTAAAAFGQSDRIKDGKMVAPVTITTGRSINSSVIFKNDETIENNVHTKWVKDNLNIDIKYDFVVAEQNNAFETKIKLLLASGEKLPDVMSLWWKSPLLAQLIESGKIMDVTSAFDKYASPRIKTAYKNFPEAWDVVSKGGKKWGLPELTGTDGADSVIWIRTDWLDKLGLKAPKTIAELEAVMDAFVNKDPDGNGKKDTLGMSMAAKGWLGGWMGDTTYLMGALSKSFNFRWNYAADGSLTYGSVQPGMKEVLRTLNNWYNKGYIDKEIGLTDEMKAAENFTSGKAGMICGPHWMGGWPLSDVTKNNPKATYKAFAFPAGPDGKVKRLTGFGADFVTVFRKDFANMDAFFLYADAFYGNRLEDTKSPFYYGLAKDYDYTFVDGKVSYDKDKIPGGVIDVSKYLIAQIGINTKSNPVEPYFLRALENRPKSEIEALRIPSENRLNLEARKIVYDQNLTSGIYDSFLGSDTPTMLTKRQLLEKMENEVFIKIIYGNQTVDSFDKFVKDWKANGGDAITKEVNDWRKAR